MRLILGGINGDYLRNITENASADTEKVFAAVAYAQDSTLLFDWCWENSIPLMYWGRLDQSVAVPAVILKNFLRRKSPSYVCKLVKHHHAKVIWWRGVGVYIGSANLSGRAWYSNVEAGCFFEEGEVDDEMASDIERLFQTLNANATPLTEELITVMEARSREVDAAQPNADRFWSSPSIKHWSGLVQTPSKQASEEKRQEFLEEWHSTLQDLRAIGEMISRDENRPGWISAAVPPGAQADQFLHAHYYRRTFEGKRAKFEELFTENKDRHEDALNDAVSWWRDLPSAPFYEDAMLNEHAPFLQKMLSRDEILRMSSQDFEAVCSRVHAIRDYARRVRNTSVSLADDGTEYTIPQKVEALARRVWNDRSGNGSTVKELLSFVLYEGSEEQLPERLWKAVTDHDWKIRGLGISALGEIVGWALPDRFPPRNGRTSKALRSLGYEATVHV